MDQTEEATKWLDRHLGKIRHKIVADAEARATTDKAEKIDADHVVPAAMRFAPGSPIPIAAEPVSLGQSLLNVPGIIWISAILAIVFGVLQSQYTTSSSLGDIAKIFAGAIVGGIGAGVASAGRRT